MFEGKSLTILGRRYRQVNDLEEHIGIGDLIQFDPPLDRDAEWYVFEYRAEAKVMVLVNWLGPKAGLETMQAMVPLDAFEPGTQFVRLGWFEENWSTKFLGNGSFEEARFYKYDGSS